MPLEPHGPRLEPSGDVCGDAHHARVTAVQRVQAAAAREAHLAHDAVLIRIPLRVVERCDQPVSHAGGVQLRNELLRGELRAVAVAPDVAV